MNPVLLATIWCLVSRSSCKIQMPEGYLKHQLPPAPGNETSFNLSLSFNLVQGIFVQKVLLLLIFYFSVREINEVEGTSIVKMSMTRSWKDQRLAFSNFGSGGRTFGPGGRTSVTISPDEWKALWIPWTVFANMRHGDSWFKSDKPDGYTAKFEDGYNSSADVHPGSRIVIEYEKETIVELMCHYHMFWYPFDSQTCGVELYQQEEDARLIPKVVTYSGPRQLIQYTVIGIEMCPTVVQVWVKQQIVRLRYS